MDEFLGKRSEGDWWIVDEPATRFSGVLELDSRAHGHLTLKGTENQFRTILAKGMRRERWTMHGEMKSGYTYRVSLFNVGMTRGPRIGRSPDDLTDAQVFTNVILIGGHIGDQCDAVVKRASLEIGGLREFVDDNGFVGKLDNPGARSGEEDVQVSFKGRKTPIFALSQGRALRIISGYRGPRMFFTPKTVTMEESDRLELVFESPISTDALLHEMVVWQSFLVFATRRASYMGEIRIGMPESKIDFPYLLLVPGTPKEPDVDPRGPHELLFTKSKLGPKLEQYLRAWRTNFEVVEISIVLFTGTMYQEGQYLHTRLLSYLQALEILHREVYGGCRFPDKKVWTATLRALKRAIPYFLDRELRDEISRQLSFVGTITLLDRLKALYRIYPQSLRQLFPDGEIDLTLLKNARNFLTHYGAQKKFDRDFLLSRQLYVLSEKTRLFVEICLLGILGLNDKEIVDLLGKFEPYTAWALEKH